METLSRPVVLHRKQGYFIKPPEFDGRKSIMHIFTKSKGITAKEGSFSILLRPLSMNGTKNNAKETGSKKTD
jgi:hypothetical protein